MNSSEISAFFSRELADFVGELGFAPSESGSRPAFWRKGPDELLQAFIIDVPSRGDRADILVNVTSLTLNPDLVANRPDLWGSPLRATMLHPRTGVGLDHHYFPATSIGAEQLRGAIGTHLVRFFESVHDHEALEPLLGVRAIAARALLSVRLGDKGRARKLLALEGPYVRGLEQSGQFPLTLKALAGLL